MLKILPLAALMLALPLSAQNRAKVAAKTAPAPAKANAAPALEAAKPEAAPEAPQSAPAPLPFKERFEVFASFSQGTRLVGYTDPRYVASDKTDYLESAAMTANLEFTGKIPYRIKGSATDSVLQDVFAGTEYLRLGGQLTGWSILNSSSVSIPKTGAPLNADAVNANLNATTRPGIGFFFGFGKRDFEIDFGVTTALAFEYEGNRTRRVVDAAGNVTGATEEVPGRGLFIANAFVLPTFRMAWGSRDDLQFFISAGRETFEYQRDYVQTYFRLPMASFLKFDFGVGLFPNATLFLQPNFVFGNIMVGVRGGISLNYYESELRRVSINDALYFAISASGRF
ncbi:hypothetical protein [Turneriella parva]|uniref:Outer membrane protein beta-barrel domain-containing protein n=1 Tax=Turneriella parva (strain ATCC BAA-1111 / DSM 21527 / NCTC 11395 / H) TaxID=869212 RepID=I4B6X6_TURPD|nr:hypothetical protein [Turneriella parva]AFM13033.1 hypothetical protein Turpa_2391 [Turneriella parva DSM 21527]